MADLHVKVSLLDENIDGPVHAGHAHIPLPVDGNIAIITQCERHGLGAELALVAADAHIPRVRAHIQAGSKEPLVGHYVHVTGHDADTALDGAGAPHRMSPALDWRMMLPVGTLDRGHSDVSVLRGEVTVVGLYHVPTHDVPMLALGHHIDIIHNGHLHVQDGVLVSNGAHLPGH